MKIEHLFCYTFCDEMELIGFADRHNFCKEDIVSINYMGEKSPKPWVLFVWDID